jgi:hypothetical protein
LTPWTIASICSNFEDYTTICKLLMLGLYNDHWLDPKSILTECTTGVYLGFVPTHKMDHTASDGLGQEQDHRVQRQTRNYLCGQMAMGDPLTHDFLEELCKRTDRLYLVVYEGTNADATVHPTEPDLFISRHRSPQTKEEPHSKQWTTTMTLEDVKNQFRMRKMSMYDPIVVDSWQFIIIDRAPNQPFELMDIVQDALLLLLSDPSPRQLAARVIHDTVPPALRSTFTAQLAISSPPALRHPPPHDVQYEGNRYRTHAPSRTAVSAQQQRARAEGYSRNERRFIRRVVDDMERSGLVSLAPASAHAEPQIVPVVMQGGDGALDLFFPYEQTAAESRRTVPLPAPPPSTALRDFAEAFKRDNPDGVVAKGSIQPHYCAWPMPMMRSLGRTGTNFATPEGVVYRWDAMREFPLFHPFPFLPFSFLSSLFLFKPGH